MNSTTKRIGHTCLVALCAFGAFAGGSGPDPIVGSYEGGAYYIFEVSANDFELPIDQYIQAAWTLRFDADHGGAVQSYEGSWKKKGAKYRSDVSAAASAEFAVSTNDPNAHEDFKCKKIVLGADAIASGKIAVKQTYTQTFVKIVTKVTGVFGCQRVP